MDMRSMAKESGNTPKTNFIPNPLPVPKRHSRREMSYDHQVPADKMHYDVDIRPGDDFDIE